MHTITWTACLALAIKFTLAMCALCINGRQAVDSRDTGCEHVVPSAEEVLILRVLGQGMDTAVKAA